MNYLASHDYLIIAGVLLLLIIILSFFLRRNRKDRESLEDTVKARDLQSAKGAAYLEEKYQKPTHKPQTDDAI